MSRQTSIRQLKKIINDTKELTCVSITCHPRKGLMLAALLALSEDNLNRYCIALLRKETGRLELEESAYDSLPPNVKCFIVKRQSEGQLNMTLSVPTCLLLEVKQDARKQGRSVAAFFREALGLD